MVTVSSDQVWEGGVRVQPAVFPDAGVGAQYDVVGAVYLAAWEGVLLRLYPSTFLHQDSRCQEIPQNNLVTPTQ